MFGSAAASFVTVWLVFQQEVSWQLTYLLYGGAGILWGLLYFALIPARAVGQVSIRPMTSADWPCMLKSAALWLLCAQQFFRAGAMIFFINWFPAFLKEARGFSEYDAGVYNSAVGLAAMFGGISGGFFSDWLLRQTGMRRLSRQGIAVFGMTAAGIAIVVNPLIQSNAAAVVLFAAAAFIASFGGVSGYTVAIELGGRRIGIVFSLMNMCGNIGGAIANYVAGSLAQRTRSWDAALFFVAAIFAVDAVCWALLNPQGPLFGSECEETS
jgi:nitrate/nitrite transporter NarK